MNFTASALKTKKIEKLHIDSEILASAIELEIDISQACERGLENAVAAERAARWMAAHREAVESYFAYVGNYDCFQGHPRP